MLRFADGFDHYANANSAEMWSASSVFGGFGSQITSGGRNSTNKAVLQGASAFLQYILPSTKTGGTFGAAFYAHTQSTNFPFLQVRTGGTTHLYLQFNGSGKIEVRRGDATLLGTGSTALSSVALQYIEFQWVISNTVGTAEVRLNGATVEVALSGIDTQNGATADWDSVVLLGPDAFLNGNVTSWDDVYLLDNVDSGVSGVPNNAFLGDTKIETLFPQADSVAAGSNAGFTPSTGTDHGALVDEATPNDDTDYNSGTATSQKDTYHYPSLSFTPTTIFGVMPCPRVKKTDAGARSVKALIRSGGTDYQGAEKALSTSYLYYPTVFESDPADSNAWTPTDVANMESGLEVTV
jgi:hypothetical protein